MTKHATLVEGWIFEGELYGPGENVAMPDEAYDNIKARGGIGEQAEALLDSEMQTRFGKEITEKLTAAGYDDLSKVSSATDEDLDKVEGIGEASIKRIREALK